jgi:hypothetical protein
MVAECYLPGISTRRFAGLVRLWIRNLKVSLVR